MTHTIDNRDNYDSVHIRLARYYRAHELVKKQAEDEGLWFIAEDIVTAHLQHELRHLHAVLEGKDGPYTK